MEQDNPYAAPASEVLLDPQSQQFDDGRWYSPSGRLGRARYFLRSIGYYFAFLLLSGLLTGLASIASPTLAPLLSVPLVIVYVIIALSQSVKRLHDLNWSGWWLLLFIIPVVNLVMGLVLLFKPGSEGPNDYGYPAHPARRAALWITLSLVLIAGAGILAAIAIPAFEEYMASTGQLVR